MIRSIIPISTLTVVYRAQLLKQSHSQFLRIIPAVLHNNYVCNSASGDANLCVPMSGWIRRTLTTKTGDTSNLPRGKVFEKFPVKVSLEAGKLYAWCTCGTSAKQPFCDGSHKKVNEAAEDKSIVFKPHRFQVEHSKDYPLCQCKQTNRQPFCDGTHKSVK